MSAACAYHLKHRKKLDETLTRLDAVIAWALRSKRSRFTHKPAQYAMQVFSYIQTQIPTLPKGFAQLGDKTADSLETSAEYFKQQNSQLWEKLNQIEIKIDAILEANARIIATLKRHQRVALVLAILISPLALPIDSMWQGSVGELVEGAARDLFANLISMFAK